LIFWIIWQIPTKFGSDFRHKIWFNFNPTSDYQFGQPHFFSVIDQHSAQIVTNIANFGRFLLKKVKK